MQKYGRVLLGKVEGHYWPDPCTENAQTAEKEHVNFTSSPL